MLPVDPLAVALVLLVAGIVASFVPLVPGGGLSMAGVSYYWYATGDPGILALLALLGLGALALVFDWLGGALAANAGGASLRTTAIAAVVTLPLLVVLGPLGLLVGVAGTVFALEYHRHGDVELGLRAAAYATVGVLASTAMQVLVTAAVLAGFLLVVFL
ncbi:DUF456 family protein [Natronomonas halophila]|uniref:DUF456 family protein n=1 Tax=Natronomonas halophila TaxID=2747817 RepID=UPI0015B5E358|nr:DUF456 family protein [Natronomonas halophila]QLD84335.1 DUF456 family protein [Natronomonas halophila]